MKLNCTLLMASSITVLLFMILLTITKSDTAEIIYGNQSPFILGNVFSDLIYDYTPIKNTIPIVKMIYEQFVNHPKISALAKGSMTIETTYHPNFDSVVEAPTILKWYMKEVIDTTKPLIVLVTMLGFLMCDLDEVIDETYAIINNDPDNEYIVVCIQKPVLINPFGIKQAEEIKIFEDASSIYQMIEIVNEKYPSSIVFLYGYSLGATTIYEYMKIYDDIQNVKLAILNSPVIDIEKFFASNTYAVKLYKQVSIQRINNIMKQFKHLFKTDDEIEHYNKLMNFKNINELVNERLQFRNIEMGSLYDTKQSTLPILAIVSSNDPILPYTNESISTYCKEFPNLTCALFKSGEHCQFKNIDKSRLAPVIIHKLTTNIISKIRTDIFESTKKIVREMNNDGIINIDMIDKIIDTPDP